MSSTETQDQTPVQAAWKLRYWSVFVGQAFSLIGSALSQFVLLWWIADTTGSAAALSAAGLAALLPQALLAPLGGILADRFSRRILMAAADLISAACMLVLIALFLSGQEQLGHVYVMMAIRSAMQAFQSPALAASTPLLVPGSFLPRAVGFNQALQGAILVAAAPLGALAMTLLPFGWALAIDAVTAVLGVLPLLFFKIPQGIAARRATLVADFLDGVRIVWRDPTLRWLYFLLAGVTLIVMPTYTMVPLLVKQHFAGGVAEVAIMEGMTGAGMVLGGIVVAALAPRNPVPWVLLGFGVSCFTLAFTALTPATLFWPAVFWWTVSGLAFAAGDGPFVVLLQTMVPNALHGRVLSLLNMAMGLAAPVGLLIAGPLAEWLGIRWAFVLMGTLAGCVVLAGFFSTTLARPGKAIHVTKNVGQN